MSYILDALRRADAERERGSVPHLNAQPQPGAAHHESHASGVRPWVWIAAGTTLGLLAALSWRLTSPSPAPVPVLTPEAVAPQPAPARRLPEPEAVSPPSPETQAEAPLVFPTPAAPTAVKRAPAASAASAETARIVALKDLPEDIRRQLPALQIGGSMYSEDAATRMLIVNGQVLREGASPAPGLVLEQIRLKSAVLRFKGYRYEINY